MCASIRTNYLKIKKKAVFFVFHSLKPLIMLIGGVLYRYPKTVDFSQVKKIIVFKTGAMGDVLMTTPFLRVLRTRFPKAEIVYYVGDWAAAILKNNPDIDRVEAFDYNLISGLKLWKLHKFRQKIKRERFDLGFMLDRDFTGNFFLSQCGIPTRIGFMRDRGDTANTLSVRYGAVKHEIDYYLELAYLAGAKKTKNKEMVYVLDAKDEAFADTFFNKSKTGFLVGLAPGGAKNPGQNMPIRRWPAESFAELASMLEKKKVRAIMFGLESDKPVGEVVIKSAPSVINTMGKTTPGQCFALMKRCSVVVSNDAGNMHMAAAVGTPVISIFGPTQPKRKAPLGKQHRYFFAESLKCAACDDDGNFPDCRTLECMRAIKPKEVFNAVMEYKK